MADYYISGIGLFSPGLIGWSDSCAILAGKNEFFLTEQPKLAPTLLPAGVRRRAGNYIRLAAEVADEAVKHAGVDASQLASIFTTSESDGRITDAICRAICAEEPVVSPTMFHNSVTNSPAGYWCMAVNSMKPSTSIAGAKGTFSVGLIEACLQIETEANDTLLVCHDVTMPHPLNKVARVDADFGVAFVLTGEKLKTSLAAINWQVVASSEVVSELATKELTAVRQGNAAAQCLPLLVQLAKNEPGHITLPYTSQQNLQITINPC